MTVYEFKKKPEVVAGVQWNGYNLIEIDEFLGHHNPFPNSEDEWNVYSKLQEEKRHMGYEVFPSRWAGGVAPVGCWIVKFEDGSHGVMSDEDVKARYVSKEMDK